MTRKEWMKEHYPETINDLCIGGVVGCPRDYWALVLTDTSIPAKCPTPNYNRNKGDPYYRNDICGKCWNHEIEEVTK